MMSKIHKNNQNSYYEVLLQPLFSSLKENRTVIPQIIKDPQNTFYIY